MCQRSKELIESLAILDYLEAKFPARSLSPSDPDAIGKMKMVQLALANEFMPKVPQLILLADGGCLSETDERKHFAPSLTFLVNCLGDAEYFGGDGLSLADLTVGAALPLARRLGLGLQTYPTLDRWCDRVSSRPAWQQTKGRCPVGRPSPKPFYLSCMQFASQSRARDRRQKKIALRSLHIKGAIGIFFAHDITPHLAHDEPLC